MGVFELLHGEGESTDICFKAYDARQDKVPIIVMSGDNKRVVSKYDVGGSVLACDIDYEFNNNLFIELAIKLKKSGIREIYVDNAELLDQDTIEQLFLTAKFLDIDVYCYSKIKGKEGSTEGSRRLIMLSDELIKLDGFDPFSENKHFHLYHGAMEVGKTASLLMRAASAEQKKKKIYILKSFHDRDPKNLVSRAVGIRRANYVFHEESLYELGAKLSKREIDIIYVDEAQFLTPAQVHDLYHINRDYSIPIECFALKIDYLSNFFTGDAALFELADTHYQLTKKCPCCSQNKTFNVRRDINGRIINDLGDQIVVDDGNQGFTYGSVCPSTFIREVFGIKDEASLIKRYERH